MTAASSPLAPSKEIQETSSDSHIDDEDPVLRQRRNIHRNEPSRHDYSKTFGGPPSPPRGTNGASISSPRSDLGIALGEGVHNHRRREIRRRLKHKKAPMVRWTKFMQSETKNNIVAVIGEFIGTTMFLFFAFAGTQLASLEVGDTSIEIEAGQAPGFNPGTLFYISASFGFSLMVNAWVFFRISGGLFNPAVTLAVALLGAIGPLRAVLLFAAQMSGACFAAYLVDVIFPTPFTVQTTLGKGTTMAQGVWIEAMCTAMLVFTIIMLAVEKHRATFMAPIAIGMALFIGELVAVYYTGGSLNPARSFGPAAVLHTFLDDHWIYWIGPFIGTLLAVSFYWVFKALEYEMVNPGQDGDAENDPTQNPDHEIAQIVEERQAEVAEIHAIEEEGGFTAVTDIGAEGSVLGQEGVIGMAVGGVRAGDEVHVQRVRDGEPDLEAAWQPPKR